MDNVNQALDKITKEIHKANCQLAQLAFGIKGIGGWLSKRDVMRFFDYGDTQMREIEPLLKHAKIGRRKFYHVSSIVALLDKHSV
jgi:hypothetical protein